MHCLLSYVKLYEPTVVDCQTPGDISNAQWNGNTTYGSIVTYTCDPGYSATGGSNITCMATRNWSDIPPVCEGEAWDHSGILFPNINALLPDVIRTYVISLYPGVEVCHEVRQQHPMEKYVNLENS